MSFSQGLHALVYDINTKNETWEWVNLNEVISPSLTWQLSFNIDFVDFFFLKISPDDIRWEGDDPGIVPQRAPQNGPGRAKKPVARPAPLGRGRGSIKAHNSNPNFPTAQNGVGKDEADVIKILHTETLIKAVSNFLPIPSPVIFLILPERENGAY